MVIKFILKWFGLAKKAISVYRIIFVSVSIGFSFIALQQYRINSKETTIAELQIKIKDYETANKTTNESLTACLLINSELTRQGAINQADSDKAIEDINKYAVKQDKKILDLKSRIKPDKNCSLDTVSTHNTELLKTANNQD